MVPSPESIYRQSGAVPFRIRDGAIEVLLITSQTSGHWIIPKGIVEPELSSAASAAQEAYEEAGVILSVSGHYHTGTPATRHAGVTYLTAAAIAKPPFPFFVVTVRGEQVEVERLELALPPTPRPEGAPGGSHGWSVAEPVVTGAHLEPPWQGRRRESQPALLARFLRPFRAV